MRLLLCAAAALPLALVAAGPVRGVPASLTPTYAGASFTCLDRSATLPASAVNDDFCDCADGSDEPGTAACAGAPGGSARFYCVNVGARGKYVPSSVVGDGVCDCCDGSDEAGAGGAGGAGAGAKRAACVDTCAAEGAAWRAAAAAAAAAAEEGARARAAYTAAAAAAKAERGAKLAAAAERATAAGAAKAKAEAAVAAAEERERAAAAAAPPAGAAVAAAPATAVAAGLGLAGATTEQAVSLIAEWVFSEGRADALAAWVTARAKEGRLAAVGGPAAGAAEAGWAAALRAPAPAPGAAGGDGEPAPPPPPASPPTSPEGDAARAALAAAVADEARAAEEARALREEDGTDFGPDGAFFPLKGKCFDLRDAQYGYSVCPYGRASQDGTHLGSFSAWRAAPAGAAGGAHGAMLFTGGSQCWGGPARSLALELTCGVKDELVSVGEPEKCTYAAVFKTPAACDAGAAAELKLSLEDESGAEL